MKQLLKYKYIFSVISILLFSTSQSLAQGGYQAGYIVKNSGDTMFGEVKVQYELNWMAKPKAKITVAKSKEKITYTANEVKSIKRGEDTFEPIPYNYYINDSLIFAQMLIKGFLTLYEVSEQGGSTGYNNMSSPGQSYWLLKKANGSSYEQVKFMGFKKQMLNYFIDCKILQDKITDKEMKRREMEDIVKFYNANCGLK